MKNVIATALIAVTLLVVAGPAAACTLTGTSTVEAATDPAYEGYWKYTVELSWDLGQFSLSHLDVMVGLEILDCACNTDLFQFDTPAGSSVGEEDGTTCALDYLGEYLCTGDPSLPPLLAGEAAVKFETIEVCDAGVTGSGTFMFYSLIAADAGGMHADALLIKHGQETCIGSIDGPLPAQDCALAADDQAWGAIKAQYK